MSPPGTHEMATARARITRTYLHAACSARERVTSR
jgi:hypothetical protein